MPLTNPSATGLTKWIESETLYSGKYYARFVPSSSQANVDVVINPKGTGAFSLQQADGTINGGNARGHGAVDLQTIRSIQAQVASGDYSFIQGSYCTASGSHSYARGVGAVIAIFGAEARASFSFFSYGDNQNVKVPLGVATTNATPKVLTSNTSAASTTNQCTLQNNQTVTFTSLIAARKQGSTTEVAGWLVKGMASRGADAASTIINSVTIETIHNPNGWTIAVSADTTNGAVAFTFTGAAATNIRVHCDVEMSQVIYA